MAKNINYYEHVRTDIFPWIKGAGIEILDVGCGAGKNGEEIKKVFNARVTGVEAEKDMMQLAKQRLDHCIHANLEDQDLEKKGLQGKSFHYILLMDILEHLKDPWSCLGYLTGFLKTDGKVILALPNVCNIKTIFEMLKGTWLYEESGIHDNTHLRWFGMQNIMEMLAGADLQMEEIKKNRYYQFHVKDGIYDIDWKGLRLKGIDRHSIENLETGHFLILACRKNKDREPSVDPVDGPGRFEEYRVRLNLFSTVLRWFNGKGRRGA